MKQTELTYAKYATKIITSKQSQPAHYEIEFACKEKECIKTGMQEMFPRNHIPNSLHDEELIRLNQSGKKIKTEHFSIFKMKCKCNTR